jgi:HYR domain
VNRRSGLAPPHRKRSKGAFLAAVWGILLIPPAAILLIPLVASALDISASLTDAANVLDQVAVTILHTLQTPVGDSIAVGDQVAVNVLHTFQVSLSDAAAVSDQVAVSVIPIDTDLGLTGMPANITVNVNSPFGAVVTYAAPTAIDEAGPSPESVVSCTPASGSTFAVGTTTVTCTATSADDTPGTVRGTFSVSVVAGPVGISNVAGQLLAAGCINNSGVAKALTAKLSAAQDAIARGNLKTATNILSAFIDQLNVQSGQHILAACTLNGLTFNPAGVLIADARSFIDSLTATTVPNPITGTVVSGTGAGQPGATVSLVDSTGATVATATTDVTGFYFFATTGLLTSGAAYTVSVTGLPAGFSSAGSSSMQRFTWSGIAIALVDFVLT